MASAILTIPKNYYPGDARAAAGIAALDLEGDGLIVRVSQAPHPTVPMLEYYGSVAYGVDRFAYAIQEGRRNEELDMSYDLAEAI